MEVNAEGEGKIAVPAKILLDTLKGLPNQPIDFNLNEENNGIEITSSYGVYRLAVDALALVQKLYCPVKNGQVG